MIKNHLQKIDEQVKSQHAYWESLSPEQRRAVVIKRRDAYLNKSQKIIVFAGIIGILFLGIAIYIWFYKYNMSPMSSLGAIIGAILAAAGFIYMNSYRIKSHSKILSGDFTDEDIIAYYREHEEVNKRAKQGHGKISAIVSIFAIGLSMYAADVWLTADAITMVWLSGISGFFGGLALFFYLHQRKAN